MVPRAALFVGAATGALLLACPVVQAQITPGVPGENENVTVDLSVLNQDTGGPAKGVMALPGMVGAPAAAGVVPPTYRPGLMVPEPEMPVSTLYVHPTGNAAALPPSEKAAEPRVVLRPPRPEAAEPAPSMPQRAALPTMSAASAPPAEPKVAAPPAPPVSRVETMPTAQPEVPAAKPASAPAPVAKPQPAKPITDVASAPPAPIIASAPPPPPEVKPEPKTSAPSASASVPPPPPVAQPSTTIPSATEPAREEKQTASLTGGSDIVEPGLATQVVFATDASKLPDDAKNVLQGLVKKIGESAELRIQLLAYAGGPSLSSSKARRLSLSRALSVRSFLIESGMRSTRIDVRALGNKTEEEPVNRVDVNIVKR